MRRRDFLWLAASAPAAPNLVLLAAAGPPPVRLARQGLRLTRCWASSTDRWRARASLLSARWHGEPVFPAVEGYQVRTLGAWTAGAGDATAGILEFLTQSRRGPFLLGAAWDRWTSDAERALDAVDQAGLAHNTVVAAVSDPDPNGAVKLSLRYPPLIEPGIERDLLYSAADLVPSVLGLGRATIPSNVEGRNLSGPLFGGQGSGADSVYILDGASRVLIRGLDKMVVNTKLEVTHLYNLGLDPNETDNRAEDPARQRTRDELRAHIRGWSRRIGEGFDPASGLKIR